ncbi:MAG: TonB-dependent receptor [Acidobacteriota bacterium]|nr:MAG: TonB-dependent receptor [Acidobacteriota bacterium]
MNQVLRLLTFSLLLILLFAPSALGQAASSSLTGTVTDESQAVIPGADVSLVNEGTGDTRITVSNDEGFFSITAIPSGTYTLKIQMPGFATWQRTNIAFRIADRINVPDIILAVAAATEEITVTSASDTIAPVDSGEKSAVITAKEIQNLSIVGRSAVELMKILPGVVYTGEGFPGETVQFNQGLGQYHVAGGRGDSGVAILSDGADVIDPGCDCGAAVTPNVDLVSEVKVQVASFGADQAKGPVVFQSVSKAGTSEFHGEGYVYWRTDKFNSQDWRANKFGSPKPEERYYFPGFNIGGPLTPGRDNLFFFAGFEWMGQNFTEGDIPAVVPTQSMRQGDFSEICSGGMYLKGYNECPVNDYWGNWTDPGFEGISDDGVLDPSLIDPGGQVLTNLFPMPNRDPALNDGWNYVSNIVKSQHRDQELVRLDWSLSDNTKLYTRFNHERQGTNYPYTLWWTNDQEVPYPSNLSGDYNTWSVSTSLANVLSPTTTNEVIFAYTYWSMPHKLDDPSTVSSSKLGYPYKGIFDNGIDMVPSMTGWSSGLATLHQSGGLLNPTIFGNKLLVSAEDNFSKVLDTHTLKIGFRWGYTTNDEPNTAYDQGLLTTSSWGDNATGNAYADLLMGRISDFDQSTLNPTAYMRRHEFSGFIQDSWKATRRLTLDLGVRIEHNGYFYDKEGHLAGFDPAFYDPNASLDEYSGLIAPYLGYDVPKSIWASPAILISPRLGFAYDISGAGKTVIRGGAGVYRYHGRGGDSFEGATSNPPLAFDVYQCCGFFLSEMDEMEPERQKANLTVLEPYNDAYPATYSFSFTVSQRLPGDIFFETSYVGNTSSHQLTNDSTIRQVNLIPEGTMPVGSDNEADYRPYHSFNDIMMKRHMLSQNYHSMQLMLNRQTGAFNFAATYTFGKALGIGGDSYGGIGINAFDIRNRNYGPLGYDRTHSFSIAYNWLLPDATEQKVLGAVVNGWQLTGITQFQSGGPIGRPGLGGTNADGGSANDAIDITGSPDSQAVARLTCDPREGKQEGEWFNPRCWEAPTIGNNGDFTIPYLKGPGFQNHDFSIFKNWQIGSAEERKLQFRVSFYNILNHPLPFFSGQERHLEFTDGVMTDEQIAIDNVGRTALKRGRRIMQFALKYMF